MCDGMYESSFTLDKPLMIAAICKFQTVEVCTNFLSGRPEIFG